MRINRLKLAYGWRSDLADLPQSAIGAATSEVKKGIATDLKWARGEIKKKQRVVVLTVPPPRGTLERHPVWQRKDTT